MAANGGAGASPPPALGQSRNPALAPGSGAAVRGEMRGKDDEFDYLFKGGCGPGRAGPGWRRGALRGAALWPWLVLREGAGDLHPVGAALFPGPL